MLKVLILSSSENVTRQVSTELLLAAQGQDCVIKHCEAEPAAARRALRAHSPNLLLVCLESEDKLDPFSQWISDVAGQIQTVVLCSSLNVTFLRRLMKLGVRQCLGVPVKSADLKTVLTDCQSFWACHPRPEKKTSLISVIPAKAGVGCSTLALSLAIHLTEHLETPALLLDGDYYGSALKFLLKLKNQASIVDAFELWESLDPSLFERLVSPFGKLDVLPASAAPRSYPPALSDRVAAVLDSAKNLYEFIVADLAGFDPLGVELMMQSDRICLVTTGELIPIHQARLRVEQLTELGLKDRLQVILNRHSSAPGALTSKQVEESIGFPVSSVMPNIYKAAQQAVLEGRSIAREPSVSSALVRLTEEFTGKTRTEAVREPVKHKYLEYFRGFDKPVRAH